ncbi:MAG: hypothetical protein ACRDJ3_01315 [Solirubrobacteraceae bacterium]
MTRTAILATAMGVLALSATAAEGSVPSSGFLAKPTDQIAVPGMLAGGEVTPEGDLYTGWGEYELRYGRKLSPWNQPTRTLPHPGVPLLSSTLSDGPVRYVQTIFAIAVAGRPVAYETVTATNSSNRPREARVAMAVAYTRGPQLRGIHGMSTGAYRYERPVSGAPGLYEQPGQPFSASFAYTTPGRDLDRSGLLLARGPSAPSRPLGATASNRTRGVSTAASSMARLGANLAPHAATLAGPTAAHDARLFSARLKPRGHMRFTWQFPLDPPPIGATSDSALDRVPVSAARAELTRMWAREEAGMTKIEVPERKVNDTYRAAIAQILASRYLTPVGWVQGVNKLQYQAFWIRDGAQETQALDLAGLHKQAAQNLEFMDTLQRPDGLFIDRVNQYDGLGEALWALSRHALLARNPAYAQAQLTRMGAAVQWLSLATATDPLGLLPASNPGDDELAFGHITGDDLWAAVGLRSAIVDAKLAGREDMAGEWQAVDTRFEASLRQAIAGAVTHTGHIPPVLDATGGQDWGNYYAAYPVQVLAPSSPAVKATVAWAQTHMREGLSTYANGSSLHDYLGFAIFQTELADGDAHDAIAGLYAELAHTTSTGGGWEWTVPPFGTRSTPVDMSPHGTFSADYVALLRNMLVAEPPSGGVSLLDGASPAWLAPGQSIAVTHAPTAYGTISFVERSTAGGETLTWHSDLAPGTPLGWTLPTWASHARGPGGSRLGSTVRLRSNSGSLSIAFDGRRPGESYARAVRELNAAYKTHHRASPLAPAAG